MPRFDRPVDTCRSAVFLTPARGPRGASRPATTRILNRRLAACALRRTSNSVVRTEVTMFGCSNGS